MLVKLKNSDSSSPLSSRSGLSGPMNFLRLPFLFRNLQHQKSNARAARKVATAAPTTDNFTLKFFDFFLPLGGPAGNEGETGAGAREGPTGNEGEPGAGASEGPTGNEGEPGAGAGDGPTGNEGEPDAGATEGPEAAACNQQVVLFHILLSLHSLSFNMNLKQIIEC